MATTQPIGFDPGLVGIPGFKSRDMESLTPQERCRDPLSRYLLEAPETLNRNVVHPAEAVACVVILLESRIDLDRQKAMEKLSRCMHWQKAPDVDRALRDVALNDYDPAMRLAAVKLIAGSGAHSVIVADTLRLSASRDSEPEIRAAATQHLINLAGMAKKPTPASR